MMSFNVYEDNQRARSYARLEFPGTYYLAYRDIPSLIEKHVNGKNALDFGCGTGRSTRFLANLGFSVIGIDISEEMLRLARQADPDGDYRHVNDGNMSSVETDSCDLVLSAFTFDNIPTAESKHRNLAEIRRILKPDGVMINLVSSPEIYTHEWASFSTKDFPENKNAKSGDKVKIIMTDVEDKRPVEDVIWFENSYRDSFAKAGLEIVEIYRPLGKSSEPHDWINETEIAPWTIYVLKPGMTV